VKQEIQKIRVQVKRDLGGFEKTGLKIINTINFLAGEELYGNW